MAEVNWEPEIREFEAQDRKSPPPAGAVVFVGSSSIRLWETLAADMAPLAVVNRGFGGSTMADVLKYANRIVIPCRPRAVVIYEGDNDINRGATPAQVAAGAEELAGMLAAALPGVRLFFMGIKPSPSRVPLWPKFVEASRLIEDFCRRSGHVYIDVAPGMLDASGRPRPELYVEDGLHMTAEGYRGWTGVVRPVLVGVLGARG
ncbi:MAG TPA: SGNH/GDSL hydrolase family protein [Planctomycetota bacterium]|nr:SGNH/GDSL hydrolase family protein [Planctomycetota bacterium]